ncbi:ABC transporter permease [Pedobacter sandarakinus]|uniref:ABC transporter permease n=1 Tax=Pedobacter sandarakinus TaxID=353156 RepID=UPI00224678D3|nr:ABC transporter permease [Pedobacter sandarakinus]MCX2574807.1 ABC transporter permease [Pedobacter sandarakinus]
MFKLNLKIALRNLWKNKGYTFINVGGLTIALAAFILVVMYANYETSYDKKNPNYRNVYVVGVNYPEFKTNYVAAPLAVQIKESFPEVELAGLVKESSFELTIKKGNNTLFTKRILGVDYDAAKILHIEPIGGLVKPQGDERLTYLSAESMKVLFPQKKDNKPEIVGFGASNSGITGTIAGSINNNIHSNFNYDGVSIAAHLGKNDNYEMNDYAIYLQLKPETNVELLEQKISNLYRAELLKSKKVSNVESTSIFLDPLANLHLRPKAGNDAPYKVLIALSTLGVLILIIACINFTNLSIAQAAKRGKEVGVKKVMGAFRYQLTTQFLVEIFMQCLVAVILALILAELILPSFNNLFQVQLSIWHFENGLFWQLPLILSVITFVAGIYPAMVLSGFKPALVLKGNYANRKQSYLLRNSLLVFQFCIAIVFIISLLTINSQLKYMRNQDLGFKPNQVVYIKNVTLFNNPSKFGSGSFEPLRKKMLNIPGIKSATVATYIPGGTNGINSYSVNGITANIDFVNVEFDYFETLDIKLKEGRFFSQKFKTDTINSAVINESTVAKYGIKEPIGKTITGSGVEYKIVGVIKDFKSQGFESAIQPTIYTIYDPSGDYKTQIMVKIEESRMAEVLATLKSKWPEINPKDGEDFRYEFLDELYGRLFRKQEQLQSVFFAAASLTIFIAVLGLFAFAKYITNSRIKEIAVRKILGANDLQIFKLLNTSFLVMVVIANLVSWPLAYILTRRWLETFAYRIDIPVLPFLLSAMITILLTIITVTVQARNAVKANPVDALKYE